MLRGSFATLVCVLVVVTASQARADVRSYLGPHPMDLDGHWDLEAGVHTHESLPIGIGPFGEVGGALVFLADPVAWGYDGEVWTYRGAHPLPGGVQAYCAIAGDHRHEFAPEGAYRLEESAGAYAYAGALRGGVAMIRPGRSAPPRPVVVARPGTPVVVGPYYGYAFQRRFATPPVRAQRATPPPPPPPSRGAGHPYTRVVARPYVAPVRVEAPPRQRP